MLPRPYIDKKEKTPVLLKTDFASSLNILMIDNRVSVNDPEIRTVIFINSS